MPKKKKKKKGPLDTLRKHLRRKDNESPMSKIQKRNDRLKDLIDNM